MKNYNKLLLLCFCLFGLTNSVAQSCPPTGFSNTISLFFFYDAGTSDCMDRPTTVFAESSEFTLVDCGDTFSVYDLTSGAPLVSPNFFTVDFGYGTCEFTNGVLTGETLSVSQVEAIFNSIKIYPNPLISSDNINIKMNSNVSVEINLFDVTGKLVLRDQTGSLTTKPINLSHLSNGVYLMQIGIDNLSVTRKVIIMK
jgi:hypothetical protein